MSLTLPAIGPWAYWKAHADHPVLRETVADLLRRQAREHGDRAALMWLEDDGIKKLTYTELLQATENAARWMLSIANPGDRVAVWSRNSAEWAIVELACGVAGMILAAWNTAWTNVEVSQAIELTDPVIVFVDVDTRGNCLHERATALAGQRVVQSLGNVRQLSSAYDRELPGIDLDTPFLIQFTSGTTGRAKGALLSHGAAVNGGFFRIHSTLATKEDVYLNPTPLHHVGGAVNMLLGSLSIAACYVVMNSSRPADLIRAARLSKATRFGGVPTLLVAMIEHPEFPKGELKFRTVGSGGAPVSEALIRRVGAEFGAAFSVIYAQSECPLISCTLLDDPADIIATTAGRPYPANDVKIVSPITGDIVRIGEVGEICVRSAATMQGYFNAPEATAKTIDDDGFLHTGDLAAMDELGYLRMRGRVREVIIRGGENIYPIEVEEALHQHPAVSTAAVIGVADEKWGQQVAAVIRLVKDETVTIDQLESFVRERIAHFKIPKYWRIVNELPMTGSGKVTKLNLENLFDKASTDTR